MKIQVHQQAFEAHRCARAVWEWKSPGGSIVMELVARRDRSLQADYHRCIGKMHMVT